MLTIIFTTLNGMQTLPRMMARLGEIQRPAGMRIIAVDNGSDDGSGAFLQRRAAELPITVLHCPQRGKNRALNHALEHIAPMLSPDELVVITDDDIVPDEDWLPQLSRCALAHPEASAFGGTITPVWLQAVPDWLPQLDAAFPVLFATTQARYGYCTSRDIYGPNMAVRASLFKRGLRFNPDIGPDGSKRFGMGSESELLRRIERAGHRMFFCEHAKVGHQIKPSLLRPESVQARANRYGRGLAMMDRQSGIDARQWGRMLGRALEMELKSVAARLPRWSEYRLRLEFWREVERGRFAALLGAMPVTMKPHARPPRQSPLTASLARPVVARTRRTRAVQAAVRG